MDSRNHLASIRLDGRSSGVAGDRPLVQESGGSVCPSAARTAAWTCGRVEDPSGSAAGTPRAIDSRAAQRDTERVDGRQTRRRVRIGLHRGIPVQSHALDPVDAAVDGDVARRTCGLPAVGVASRAASAAFNSPSSRSSFFRFSSSSFHRVSALHRARGFGCGTGDDFMIVDPAQRERQRPLGTGRDQDVNLLGGHGQRDRAGRERPSPRRG